jgi:hypothetical protein
MDPTFATDLCSYYDCWQMTGKPEVDFPIADKPSGILASAAELGARYNDAHA